MNSNGEHGINEANIADDEMPMLYCRRGLSCVENTAVSHRSFFGSMFHLA